MIFCGDNKMLDRAKFLILAVCLTSLIGAGNSAYGQTSTVVLQGVRINDIPVTGQSPDYDMGDDLTAIFRVTLTVPDDPQNPGSSRAFSLKTIWFNGSTYTSTTHVRWVEEGHSEAFDVEMDLENASTAYYEASCETYNPGNPVEEEEPNDDAYASFWYYDV